MNSGLVAKTHPLPRVGRAIVDFVGEAIRRGLQQALWLALLAASVVVFGLTDDALLALGLGFSEAAIVALGILLVRRATLVRLLRESSSGALFRDAARAFEWKASRRFFRRTTQDVLRDLEWLAARRRQPIEILLEDVRAVVTHYETDQGIRDARPWVAAYLAGAYHLSELQRDRTADEASRHLAEAAADDKPHYFVTYGASGLVARALELLANRVYQRGPLRVLAIKDVEYEVGAHTGDVLSRRVGAKIDLRVIDLATFRRILAGDPGPDLAVEATAEFDLLLGCERLDPEQGAFFAVRDGTGTSRTQQLLAERGRARRRSHPLRVHLLCESYKIRRMGPERRTSAPLRDLRALGWYLLMNRLPTTSGATLVSFPLRDFFDDVATDKSTIPITPRRAPEHITADLERAADWRERHLPRALATGRLDPTRFAGKRFVLLGLDAVVETGPVDYGTFADALAPHLTLTEGEYEALINDRSDESGLRALLYARNLASLLGRAQQLLHERRSYMASRFHERPRPLAPREGASPLIQQLVSTGIEVHLLTAYERDVADMVLVLIQMPESIASNVHECSGDEKSSEAKFRALARGWGAAPAECLLIDDSATTIKMAGRAGWDTFHVSADHPLSELMTKV